MHVDAQGQWAYYPLALLLIGATLVTTGSVEARAPRHGPQRGGHSTVLQPRAAEPIVRAPAPPQRTTNPHRDLSEQTNRHAAARSQAESPGEATPVAPQLREVRVLLNRASRHTDPQAARQLYDQVYALIGALEADLNSQIGAGNVVSMLVAALRLFRAERWLRQAAKGAIHREGSTSMSILGAIQDEIQVPHVTPERLSQLESMVSERSAQARSQRGALDVYQKIIRERRQGLRFDPWRSGAHDPAVLVFVRLLQRASLKSNIRQISGWRLPSGWRPFNMREELADAGYAKMVEVSEELIDGLLAALDPTYEGPDERSQQSRLGRRRRARLNEIMRLARHAHDGLTHQYTDRRALGRDNHDLATMFADGAELLIARLEMDLQSGLFSLTREERQQVKQAKQLIVEARRRERHQPDGTMRYAGHLMGAIVLNWWDWGRDNVSDKLSGIRQDILTLLTKPLAIELAKQAAAFRRQSAGSF